MNGLRRQEDLAEIESGRDLADFVAHQFRDERGLRVVDDDARPVGRTSSCPR